MAKAEPSQQEQQPSTLPGKILRLGKVKLV